MIVFTFQLFMSFQKVLGTFTWDDPHGTEINDRTSEPHVASFS